MFKPLSLYIGLRYIRAKRNNRFISFISLVSMIGIALGVMVLITVLSVMNGFDQQIRNRIFTLIPHITVNKSHNNINELKRLIDVTQHTPGILSAAPTIDGQGLLTHDGLVNPIVLQAIDPITITNVSILGKKMILGSLKSLKPHGFGIVLGQSLAMNLGVGIGDKINLVTPQASVTPVGIMPRFKRFNVVGIFSVGTGFGFDSSYAFINLSDGQTLYGLGNKVTTLQLKIKDLFAARQISSILSKKLGNDYLVSNWTEHFGAFYHAVKMEKSMMFFILLLLIAIAAFNLVSGLVMLVNDKQADIAILRTFGATPCRIMSIFIVQGGLIGVSGTIIGLVLGILLSLNITSLVNFIQNTFHIQLLTTGVYFVNYLPSQLQFSDVVKIVVAALLMSFVATVYPAWRASRVQPVEALRYE